MKIIALLAISLLVIVQPCLSQDLASWKETPAKERILKFVEEVTDSSSSKFVPEPDRLAVFDNDGTLMLERPQYAHLAFLESLAATRPDVRRDSLLSRIQRYVYGDFYWLLQFERGMKGEEYQAAVANWIGDAVDPRFHMPVTKWAYEPMLELLRLLAARGFAVYICSGSDTDFLRGFSGSVYGIPAERVIGSTPVWDLRYSDSGLDLLRDGRKVNIDLNEYKAINIFNRTGKRPLIAGGNANGDLQMLLLSQGSPSATLQLLIAHDDADREYAYQDDTDQVRQNAASFGWQLVSMKDDWGKVFQ